MAYQQRIADIQLQPCAQICGVPKRPLKLGTGSGTCVYTGMPQPLGTFPHTRVEEGEDVPDAYTTDRNGYAAHRNDVKNSASMQVQNAYRHTHVHKAPAAVHGQYHGSHWQVPQTC